MKNNMKKVSLILLALVAGMLSVRASETTVTLVDSTWSCGDNWSSGFVQINKSELTGIAAGDKILVDVSAVSATDQYPCVYLQYVTAGWADWADFANTEPRQVLLSSDLTLPYRAEFVLTQTMIDSVMAGEALIVKGSGFTSTGVYWTHYDEVTPAQIDTVSIWSGTQAFGNGWSEFVTLDKALFDKAAEGDEMLVHVTAIDRSQSAQGVSLQNGKWANFTPEQSHWFSAEESAPLYVKFSLTQAMLTEIGATGMVVVKGVNYTMDEVVLVVKGAAERLSVEVPVHHNWVWENEAVEIAVQVKNPKSEAAEVALQVDVKTDKGVAVASVKDTAMAAEGVSETLVPLSITEAGIYQVSVSANEKLIKTFNIAYNPTAITSPTDYQSDFVQFWNDTKAALAAIEPNYTLTELPERSSAARKVYLLEFRSLSDMGDTAAIARAYWAEPTDGKTHTVNIHYMGYDSGYEPWIPNGDDNPNECDLMLSTRGQLINNRAPYANTYGDWFAYGFDSKEHYYYRGAYMDAVRALDFVWTRPAADTLNVFAQGSSQGGALTYAAAALGNHRFNAIAPSIPFMGDFPDYFQISNWPKAVAEHCRDSLNMSDEAMYTMLSYFDTKNLATLITCPVIQTIGLQDPVCPPHTNLAPYNNLPAGVEKELHIQALLQHEVSNDWWNTFHAFFERFLHSTTSNATITKDNATVSKTLKGGMVVIRRGENEYTMLGSKL